jgi:hypothetical protein
LFLATFNYPGNVHVGMRAASAFFLAILVTGMLLVPVQAGRPDTRGIAPLDSDVRFEAGHWNTSFLDTYGESLNATVFYPARTEGELTQSDPTDAPYPVLCFVPQEGVRPVFDYYGSYGHDLSRLGFITILVEMEPHEGLTDAYTRMANSTLDALTYTSTENGRLSSPLFSIVNVSAMAVAGHGTGAKVALLSSVLDGGAMVSGVATLGMMDTGYGTPVASSLTGSLDMPLHVQGGSRDGVAHRIDWYDSFTNKAVGYVSLMVIGSANNSYYQDARHPEELSAGDEAVEITRGEQHNLSMNYLLAFLDTHLKGDIQAATKLYGAQARADLDSGVLMDWTYGVLDMGITADLPINGSKVPAGILTVSATVKNIGPFPLTGRNVTLEIVRVVPGNNRALQIVFGPENRTTRSMLPGAMDTVQWTPLLTAYGEHIAFVRMKDLDHNRSNDMAEVHFTVLPLTVPAIDHEPPEALELGGPYNLTCQLTAAEGVQQSFLNYTDEDTFTWDLHLTQDGTTDTWYVMLPAPGSIGQVSYSIHAQSTNGAWNITNPYYIPIVDSLPPEIDHTPPAPELPVSLEFQLNATVTDHGGLEEVRLLYTEPASGAHNVTCGRDGDLWFYPMVLGPLEGVLEYTWYALDTWGNVASLGPFEIDMVDLGPPTIRVIEQDQVELGDDVVLEAEVTDDSIVGSVWVVYRMPGADEDVNGTPELVGPFWRLSIDTLTVPGTLTYRWGAEDVNGYTNETGEYELEVIDTSPPEISEVVAYNTTVGPLPTIEARVEDAGGVASVIVQYTDINGDPGSEVMELIMVNYYRAKLPAQPRSGSLTYKILAVDNADNEAETSLRTVVIQDVDPPQIAHVLLSDLVEGQEVEFLAQVTDNVGVQEVWLYLRTSVSGTFRRIAMEEGQNDFYSYLLPEGELLWPSVMYYFEAEDMPPSSNVAMDPPGAPQFAYFTDVAERNLTLWGYVRTPAGKAIAGASIVVEGHEDVVVTSDDEGRYEIDWLTKGWWTIFVSAKDYVDDEFDVEMSLEQEVKRHDVQLEPEDTGGGNDEDRSLMLYLAVVLIVASIIIVLYGLSTIRKPPGSEGT